MVSDDVISTLGVIQFTLAVIEAILIYCVNLRFLRPHSMSSLRGRGAWHHDSIFLREYGVSGLVRGCLCSHRPSNPRYSRSWRVGLKMVG